VNINLCLLYSIKILLFLEKYLSTFINSDKDVASAKDVAIRAVKLVLKSPVVSFVSRVDIVGNPAVVALKSDAKHAKLVQLLEIYSTQTLTEYLAFQKSAGSFFKDNGLKEEDCAAFMRLFTLCSFPTGFDEIPYATVAKKLSIKEDEVEPWVVKAVTQNVIQAKIDQLKKSVVISRTLQRGFGLEQWKEVQVKLNLYTKNVGAMLEAVRNARNL
jgi:translation initiation factor 3 subunit M